MFFNRASGFYSQSSDWANMDGLTIAVPSSLVREAEDEREATRKIGSVARAATVFRARRLVVFPDREGESRLGGEFVRTVLAYASTPPRLRSELWRKRDELAYVGVLPPLRVPSQTGSTPDGAESSTQGIVTKVGPDDRVRVNCALAQHPISLLVPDGLSVREGERVTLRVSSRDPLRARITGYPEAGFQVTGAELTEVIAEAGLTIAASRHGQELSVSRLGEVVQTVSEADGTAVVFGAPQRGLPAMLGVAPEQVTGERASAGRDQSQSAANGRSVDTGADPGFDCWLNTIPNQGSEVVRTEEAVFATLASLSLTE